MTVRAAGILFKAKDGRALFLKRGNGGDHPGAWCFPGGHAEPTDADAEATAKREALEEIGSLPPGHRRLLARSIRNDLPGLPLPEAANGAPGGDTLHPSGAPGTVDFTTFLQEVDEPFDVEIEDEHVGFAWAPVDQPPEPLHPGCRVALARLSMDELGVARAMAAGELSSPQRYHNVTLWAMRITGTGVALRRAVTDKDGKVVRGEEFPWRDPALYLTDEFLARCNGLPVIWLHPKAALLNSKEYAEKVIGAIMLPYLRLERGEVWGIAKVYDDEANEAMESDEVKSTSPAVLLSDPGSPSYRMKMEDGSNLLIEGKPSLLDHLAICERGVWDKGGEPAGIINDSTKGINMTEEEKKAKALADAAKADAEEKAKADAEEKARVDAKLDKLLTAMDGFGSKMDAVCNRMDAFEEGEKAKKDAEGKTAEEVAADKAKKDADDKEKAEKEKADAEEKAEKEEKEKADAAAKADAEATAKRIADIEARLPKERTDADVSAMTAAQAKADAVYHAFGKSAPRFLNGEELLPYRRRLVREFQEHSPAWKPVDLGVLADDAAFGIAEKAIYEDALVAAKDSSGVEDGGLRMVSGTTPSGHREVKFYGRTSSLINKFSGSKRFATRINPNPAREVA